MRTPFLVICLMSLLLGSWAEAHPHNVSIGTAEWIAETQSLEVALQVSVEDLEIMLIEQLKQQDLRLDGKSKVGHDALKKYILAQLDIQKPDKTSVPAKWIGYEVDDATAWIYIEFTLGPAGLEGHVMQNTILIDTHEEQVNLVNLVHGKRRKTLKFRQRDRTQKLPSW